MAEREVTEWEVGCSRECRDTINPINQFLEIHFAEPVENCKKELITLAKGDPTVYGNLPPHPAVEQALKDAIESGRYIGYEHSSGIEETRQAIAENLSRYSEKNRLSYDDIFLTPGAHCALEVCYRVLVDPGKTILLPSPCYTIYRCLAGAIGIKVKHYNLLSEQEWQVDLAHLDQLLREGGTEIAAMVINNPSNPCGSVYSRQHLLDILKVLERYRVPVIADEVYMDMVYKGREFVTIGSLSDNVPVLSVASLSKKYLVPGWRVGWIATYNRHNSLAKVKPGIARMLQKVLVPSPIMQGAIPDVLKNVPDSYVQKTMEVFESNANVCCSKLSAVRGLTPVQAAGAMYIVIKIDKDHFPEFEDDVAFMKQLIREQGVMGFPASIFQYPWAMRVALIMPQDKLAEACSRLAQFCQDHYR